MQKKMYYLRFENLGNLKQVHDLYYYLHKWLFTQQGSTEQKEKSRNEQLLHLENVGVVYLRLVVCKILMNIVSTSMTLIGLNNTQYKQNQMNSALLKLV